MKRVTVCALVLSASLAGCKIFDPSGCHWEGNCYEEPVSAEKATPRPTPRPRPEVKP